MIIDKVKKVLNIKTVVVYPNTSEHVSKCIQKYFTYQDNYFKMRMIPQQWKQNTKWINRNKREMLEDKIPKVKIMCC